MQGVAKIIERLNKDMDELKLHKAGLVPNEEAMAKLETLIQIKKEALKDMGLDIEVHNLDHLGEEAAQLQGQHDTLLWEVEVATRHFRFVETIINLFKSRMPILPVKPSAHLGSDNSCVQLGNCVACGMSLMQTVVIGVYMLRCQHPYHPLCFVTACKSVGQCLFHGCEEPLKDALKLLAPGEANMDEHVGTEKDPMEGIFGSPTDGIDVVGAQSDASKESAEVPLKPELAMNKDVEDAEKSSKEPIEKDTTVNLSDEDADLLILYVCREILGRRKKRSNTEERATPKKKAKVESEPPEPTPGELSWIGDVQELDEKVEDISAKQNADVTPDKVEEDQEPTVCSKIEEILPNCPGWGYLVLNFCKIKKLIVLNLNGVFVKRDVSKCDPNTRQIEHPPRPASDRVKLKRVNKKLWIYYGRDVEQFIWDLRQIADAVIWSTCIVANIELIICTCWLDIWEHRTYYFRYLFSDWQCEKWSYFEEIAKAPRDLAGKPMFFKPLYHVWNKFPEYDSSWTLLVDDSRYKNMRNV
ncbi:hypothetical protein L7F22_031719 [Adiantum nelumboides]|nr:hypothetical protein [Adiantum nelumboides]